MPVLSDPVYLHTDDPSSILTGGVFGFLLGEVDVPVVIHIPALTFSHPLYALANSSMEDARLGFTAIPDIEAKAMQLFMSTPTLGRSEPIQRLHIQQQTQPRRTRSPCTAPDAQIQVLEYANDHLSVRKQLAGTGTLETRTSSAPEASQQRICV